MLGKCCGTSDKSVENEPTKFSTSTKSRGSRGPLLSPRASFTNYLLGFSDNPDAERPYDEPDLDAVLRGNGISPYTRMGFMDHLHSEHNAENLAFWSEVEALRKKHGEEDAIEPEPQLLVLPEKLHEVEIEWIKGIVEEFVAEGAPNQVNISHQQRDNIIKGENSYARTDPEKAESNFVFKEAQGEVRKLMLQDSWPRFVRQCMTQNLNKAEKTYRLYMGAVFVFVALGSLALMLSLMAPRFCAFITFIPWALATDNIMSHRSGLCVKSAMGGKRMLKNLGMADRFKDCMVDIKCPITRGRLKHTAWTQFKKTLIISVLLTLASFCLFYIVEAGVGRPLYGVGAAA